MNEIKITEENYEMYKKFYEIKTGTEMIKDPKHPYLWGFGVGITLLDTFVLGFGFLAILFRNSLIKLGIDLFSFSPIVQDLTNVGVPGLYITCYGLFICKGVPKFMEHMKMGDFLKQYSQFDIDTDIIELEKALEEYETQFMPLKNIEEAEKQEEILHLALPPQAAKMTAEEIVDYFNQEINLLSQTTNQETELDEGYQKRIKL